MKYLNFAAFAVKRAEETSAEGEPAGTVEPEANLETSESEDAGGMWDELYTDSETDDTEGEGVEDTPPVVADPAEETPTETIPPEGEVSTPEEPAAEGDAKPEEEPPTPAEEEPPAATDTPAQALTPEQQQAVTAELQVARGKVEEQLTSLYELTDDDAQTLQLEPEKVLPQIAAKLHMNIIEALHEGIQNQLPQMIAQVNNMNTARDKSVSDFYEVWPQLKDDKYNDTVLRSMQAYRGANPTATLAQMVQEGGAMAMVALKLSLEAAGESSVDAEPVVAAAAPVVPLTPGGGAIQATPVPGNEFSEMFMDAIEEDM